MKITIAILALVAVAGCATLPSPYEQAIIAHGTKFSAPKDSTFVMWTRAIQWMTNGRSKSLSTNAFPVDSLMFQTWGKPAFLVLREEAGDSIVFQVKTLISPFLSERRDADTTPRARRGAHELAYFIHYGITRANFTEPAK